MLLIIWYNTCLSQGDNSRSNRKLLAILFCRFVGEPWCSFSVALFPTWMVGQTQTPNSSSLRSRFRLDWKGLVKSSGLKCTEHMEEVFPGVQCLRVSFTNFIHRCLLRRTSGLGYQKESYARWFLSLYFESCCIQKPHIFQPFSLFTIEALPRIFGYFCTMSFSYVTLHIWTHLAEWGTNANDRWKYWQDCLHF